MSESAVSLVSAEGGMKILKLHPHIKTANEKLKKDFDLHIVGSVPAEVLIMILAKTFKFVNVIHHGSSVVRYVALNNVAYQEI